MRIEFTDDEVATILVALDNYRELMNDRFHWTDDEADQQEAGSAEWCWQKLSGADQEQFNNSVADAVGEGEQPNNTTNASVDPFTLPMRSNYENMK